MALEWNMLRRLPSPERLKEKGLKPVRSRAGTLLYAGMIVLLLGVIAFSVYQVARHVTVGLSTLRTQEITDEAYVNLELYLFRDEQVLYAEGGDLCLYTVSDGEKVGVGASLGTAYTVGDPETAANLQTTLNAFGDRIALLRELGGLGTPADAREVAEAVDRQYLGLLEAVSRGDLSAASGFAGGMLEGMDRYDILTGGLGENTSVKTLEAARAALVEGYPIAANLTTARGGYFYYGADGYESVFDYTRAMTMTAEEFLAMTEEPAADVPSGVVGKMVWSPLWYAAAYLPLTSDTVFEVGASYSIRCKDSAGTAITMKVERMVPDSEGVLVVFSTRAMPDGFSFERCIRAETVSHRVEGYRIPTEALVTVRSEETGENVTGVYVLVGNVVEFRKVRIKVRREGYVIAETYGEVRALLDSLDEAAYDRFTADGWSYLKLNDNIITGGNGLYEGKMIG